LPSPAAMRIPIVMQIWRLTTLFGESGQTMPARQPIVIYAKRCKGCRSSPCPFCFVKLPLAKARGFSACRTALWDSRRCQVGNGYSIPGLASAFSTDIRATRSDAKSDVGKGKAPPSRRFKSVRCRSQERLRTCPRLVAWIASRQPSWTYRARLGTRVNGLEG
jgi:hypothetical protein